MRAQTEPSPRANFTARGWVTSDNIDGLHSWLDALDHHAERALRDPANAKWLRAGGTWYAGVNLLNNDPSGACPGGPPLPTSILQWVSDHTGHHTDHWDAGQLSVVYPGYPRPDPGESEASYRYRLQRDAAHVDGLHPVGPERRRHANEYHAFVLGLPWANAPDGGSPLAVWEGSHHIIKAALQTTLAGVPPARWHDVDLTEPYHRARKTVFAECRRVEVSTDRGGAYLVHRLAVHGIAPWRAGGNPELRRAVCYFRPALPNPAHWLAD